MTDLIAEVQRRLDTFHSPSFDRETVEQLLNLARRNRADGGANIVMKHENINDPSISEGDLVRTVKGARYEGVVDVIFMTKKGNLRAVVEAVDPRFEETLHVYPLSQLRRVLNVG